MDQTPCPFLSWQLLVILSDTQTALREDSAAALSPVLKTPVSHLQLPASHHNADLGGANGGPSRPRRRCGCGTHVDKPTAHGSSALMPSPPLFLPAALFLLKKKKKSKIGFKLISSHHFSDCILGQFPSQYLQQSTVFCVCGFLKLSLNISSIPV